MMTPVRLEPAVPRSRVKHSTTEPLRSLIKKCVCLVHCVFVVGIDVLEILASNNEMQFLIFKDISLKPKVTLHFELPKISLLFLILTKLNIAWSCWYMYPPLPNSRGTYNLG